MFVSMRLMGVLNASDEQRELPGHPGISGITFDLGEVFELEVTRDLIGRRVEIPLQKGSVVQKLGDAASSVVNMGLNIEMGTLNLGTLSDILQKTGKYGEVTSVGTPTSESLQTLREAGLDIAYPVVPAVKQ